MTDVVETKRFVPRPPRLEDAAQAQKLFPLWEIVKFLAAIVLWPYFEDGALFF